MRNIFSLNKLCLEIKFLKRIFMLFRLIYGPSKPGKRSSDFILDNTSYQLAPEENVLQFHHLNLHLCPFLDLDTVVKNLVHEIDDQKRLLEEGEKEFGRRWKIP